MKRLAIILCVLWFTWLMWPVLALAQAHDVVSFRERRDASFAIALTVVIGLGAILALLNYFGRREQRRQKAEHPQSEYPESERHA